MSTHTIQELQDKIVVWRNNRLAEHSAAGAIEHLIEEAKDLKKNPNDVFALADVGILWMSICEEAGFSMDEMLEAVAAKQAINESREWGSADEEGVIRHIESTRIG